MPDFSFDENLTQQGKLQLFVDHRELKSPPAKALFEKGVLLRPVSLFVGDFVPSDRVAVERKSSLDFENSIIDGRLFSQALELKRHFSSPLLALVGNRFERLDPKAVQGALISICVDYRLPVVRFSDDSELADFILALCQREQLVEHRTARMQFSKKGPTLAEQQQLIVESLPGIGPKVAKSLLAHFKSIQSLANADEKALQDVEGIAKGRAKVIRKVFESDFVSKVKD